MHPRLIHAVLFGSFFSASCFAHPGRTDANGGHTDRRTGAYHYHGGGPARSYTPSPITPPANAPPPQKPTPPEVRPYPGGSVSAEKQAEAAAKLLDWHKSQAAAGSASAQYEMGMRHLTGNGVVQSCEKAREWLIKAAKQENLQAYERLKNLDYCVEKKDENGRVVQSRSARTEFLVKTRYERGRVGYVITHVKRIKDGGSDAVENFVWEETKKAFSVETWE